MRQVYDSNELIECRVHPYVAGSNWQNNISQWFSCWDQRDKNICISILILHKAILNIDNNFTFDICVHTNGVICTFFRIYICVHSFLFFSSCEWARMCISLILYLNFYETHTYAHSWCQTILFVRVFIPIDPRWVKSRSSLYISFSLVQIYSVQLSTKHKSYIHMHIDTDLSEARKRKLKNCNYTIGTWNFFLFWHTHIYQERQSW